MANFNGDDYSFEEDESCYNDENEGCDEDRVRFYKKVVHDEEEYDEESLNLWANQRFKQKRTGRVHAVDLPREKKEEEEIESEAKHEVKLNLPQGGWKVQNLTTSNEALPSLLESKIAVSAPKKKPSFSRPTENAWKKLPNFFEGLTVVDQLATLSDIASKEQQQQDEEEEYKPVKSSERRPRLMQSSAPSHAPKKTFDKPQNLKNTKMCKAGEKCSRRNICNFAHTLEDYNPIFCNFQKNCKNFERCSFRHEWESKEEFLARVSLL